MKEKQVSITELARKLSRVIRSRKTTIITRFGKPHSVVICYDDYADLLEKLDRAEIRICDLEKKKRALYEKLNPKKEAPKFRWK